ncbi:MAG: hypothetical protein ACRDXC_00835 [Acidimicrobiales bacterium]
MPRTPDEHEPEMIGSRPLPPKRSSDELLARYPEMPPMGTLPHSETPLTDEERELLYDLLYR